MKPFNPTRRGAFRVITPRRSAAVWLWFWLWLGAPIAAWGATLVSLKCLPLIFLSIPVSCWAFVAMLYCLCRR
jgi:hypothetical protein